MQDFKQLKVWIEAKNLALEIYRTTREYPVEERYGLALQMRRAAMSVCANIAEGRGRGTDTDFKRFLHMAKGSMNELQCYVILSGELGMVDAPVAGRLDSRITGLSRMLVTLIRRLRHPWPSDSAPSFRLLAGSMCT